MTTASRLALRDALISAGCVTVAMIAAVLVGLFCAGNGPLFLGLLFAVAASGVIAVMWVKERKGAVLVGAALAFVVEASWLVTELFNAIGES